MVVGSAQRFGVPLGLRWPPRRVHGHQPGIRARSLPGRLVGVSVDADGSPRLPPGPPDPRAAHPAGEGHVEHLHGPGRCWPIWPPPTPPGTGPTGLVAIAHQVHGHAAALAGRAGGAALSGRGFTSRRHILRHRSLVTVPGQAAGGHGGRPADRRPQPAPRSTTTSVGVSLRRDQHPEDRRPWFCRRAATSSASGDVGAPSRASSKEQSSCPSPPAQPAPDGGRGSSSTRTSTGTSTEHEMLRWLRRLSDRDLSLDRTMIPLGSCTMKLNAAAEMEPISWPEFASIHPFAPADQTEGYRAAHRRTGGSTLAEITGYHRVSLQPNAGSQGEYAGLLAIRAWQAGRGEGQPRCVPDPVVGPRHQRRLGGAGRDAGGGRGLRRRGQHRSRRSGGQDR